MMIENDVLSYLNGKKFSTGYRLKLDGKYPIKTRIDSIKELAKNKSVIHLGCCDHFEVIDDKIASNQWLQGIINDISTNSIGIDINQEAIKYLKDHYGYTNLIYADLLAEEVQEIKNQIWDLIFLGEIIEHLDNPILFLNSINSKYKNNIKKIAVTVPNIMSLAYGKQIYKLNELINSDHRYWFTPYTVLKVMHCAGIKPIELKFADPFLKPTYCIPEYYYYRLLGNSYPFYYFSTIICIGELQ
ncbi:MULTISPECIES: hypothetical protein [Methylomonas]|uniref:Methyltransferase domain-containing protein n=2 Tax=Methylomonas TaxID=416 RepID=A0A140E5M6_9GAMM|nr:MULTISPECIES: hypothetical protein [Methylomonas]AMK78700.1 hypothetical protein JT25_019770 [Methylomonas denitrificans]OAI03696.1 hypothetical protein A1342_01025 [Methylomonas methanica]TCV83547.1 hypothetical protein EDE11_109104 [Methylomonas methanica]